MPYCTLSAGFKSFLADTKINKKYSSLSSVMDGTLACHPDGHGFGFRAR